MSVADLFEWVDSDQGPFREPVLPSAVAIVRDKSNRSPYHTGSDPVLDYAAAGEVVFAGYEDKIVGVGRFAFTDRQRGDRTGPQDRITFEIDRDGGARMRLLDWGGVVRELTRVVVEDGPYEGTFLRGYFDRGFDGAGLVTMSFDRGWRTRLR